MSKVENQQNDYRAERKKRLAKNAKKNSQKSVDSVIVVTWIVRAASIVLALAIAAFALYQFGVPQKLLPAVQVGDRTYSVAEYSYYYSSVFQNYAQQSSSLQSSYGYMTFDTHRIPLFRQLQMRTATRLLMTSFSERALFQLLKLPTIILQSAKLRIFSFQKSIRRKLMISFLPLL